MWTRLLVVGLGGFAGAIARYALSGAMQRRFADHLPVGTLVVNVAGCLLIGALMGGVERREDLSEATRLLLLTGFLGSFTTFSTFGWETFSLFRQGAFGLALASVAAHLLLGLAALYAGWQLVR